MSPRHPPPELRVAPLRAADAHGSEMGGASLGLGGKNAGIPDRDWDAEWARPAEDAGGAPRLRAGQVLLGAAPLFLGADPDAIAAAAAARAADDDEEGDDKEEGAAAAEADEDEDADAPAPAPAPLGSPRALRERVGLPEDVPEQVKNIPPERRADLMPVLLLLEHEARVAVAAPSSPSHTALASLSRPCAATDFADRASRSLAALAAAVAGDSHRRRRRRRR